MILVIGGTGTTGTEILKELSRLGARTRALVRKKSHKIEWPGVEQVEGDLGRPEMIAPALEGVQSAFLLTAPAPDADRLQGNFIGVAKRTKLPHLVKYSAYGAAPASPARFLRQHGDIEKKIQDTGIPYTFLRPAQFMQNFVGFRETIMGQGEFYAPQGDGRINLVDVRDAAAVAARVLTEPGHTGEVYEITGPEAITYTRVAEALSQALDRPVRYVNVPPEVYRQALARFGVPEWIAEGIVELHDIWRIAGATGITNVVEKIAKKKPYSIAEFARDYAPQFLGEAAARG
jgi:uncharacterized protein YbjT (DUF2867 family)